MNDDILSNIINTPGESLKIEKKNWIDPTSYEGKAKIAKASIALYNNGGGYLAIGFKDGEGSQIKCTLDRSARILFEQDSIQKIISDYSSQKFEIMVNFRTVNDIEHPIIEVPSGVRTPVYAKSDIPNQNDPKKTLLKANQVYVRTYHSNGIVSSAEPRANDWETLMQLCFDNREADIGKFVRRHLTEDNINLISKSVFNTKVDKIDDILLKSLDEGYKKYQAACYKNKYNTNSRGSHETYFPRVRNAIILNLISDFF